MKIMAITIKIPVVILFTTLSFITCSTTYAGETYSNGFSGIRGYASDSGGDFPQGSQRLLNYDELKSYSDKDLALTRNEIFARKGYDFSGSKYETYFYNKSWYNPVKGSHNPKADNLSELEQKNIYQIKFVEGQRIYDAGNYNAAYPLLLDSAEHGVVAAQNYIGIMYENGLAGLPQGSGIEWFKMATEQGDAWAANKVGELLLTGKINLMDFLQKYDKPETPQVVAACLFSFAASSGYAPGEANYGKVLYEHPEIEQRVVAYLRQINGGDKVVAYLSHLKGEDERPSISDVPIAIPEKRIGENYTENSDSEWGSTAIKVVAGAVALYAAYKAAQAAAQAASDDDSSVGSADYENDTGSSQYQEDYARKKAESKPPESYTPPTPAIAPFYDEPANYNPNYQECHNPTGC